QTNENISEDVLASCLSELDYHFYVRQEDNRFYKKSKRGKARASFFDLPDDVHVYVNVSSKVVLELYKASNSMAYKKTAVAIEIITAIKKRIDFFFENKKRLAGE
ncbi:MAG: hypothetical protein JJE25_10565, partial [Bacteroidia bacterium]|nr:hypothetical protein [Bacteroidia bacterium]